MEDFQRDETIDCKVRLPLSYIYNIYIYNIISLFTGKMFTNIKGIYKSRENVRDKLKLSMIIYGVQ